MLLKGIIDEDFTNYKLPSILIIFPTCSWKCGENICQNRAIKDMPNITIDINEIVQRYIANPISKALVCSGLEPFDCYDDLLALIKAFRKATSDTIVVYTGYTEEEVSNIEKISNAERIINTEKTIDMPLHNIENIIIKFGRYTLGQKAYFDKNLGVNLSSDNQYARQINQ